MRVAIPLSACLLLATVAAAPAALAGHHQEPEPEPTDPAPACRTLSVGDDGRLVLAKVQLPSEGCAASATVYDCDPIFMPGPFPDFHVTFSCEPLLTLP